jgi:hypothetical protein
LGADLVRQFLSRLGAGFEEVWNSKLGKTGDGPCDMSSIQQLKHADVGWGSLGLYSHFNLSA